MATRHDDASTEGSIDGSTSQGAQSNAFEQDLAALKNEINFCRESLSFAVKDAQQQRQIEDLAAAVRQVTAQGASVQVGAARPQNVANAAAPRTGVTGGGNNTAG